MSRAFVKENDDVEPLPERPVSPYPNYVTPEGLALIDAELERLKSAYGAAQASADRDTLASVARDLRYWQQRRASAELVAAATASEEVHFGSRVTIERDDGRRQTWRIVGEDEADPAKGTVSYIAPVARVLIGKRLGDTVTAGQSEATIVAID